MVMAFMMVSSNATRRNLALFDAQLITFGLFRVTVLQIIKCPLTRNLFHLMAQLLVFA